jgi:excisionase family DNA binding protein
MNQPEPVSTVALPDEDELSVTEIATALGLTPAAVRIWVREDRLNARKDGRRWLIRRDDVVELLNTHPQLGKPHLADRRGRRDAALAAEHSATNREGPRAIATGVLQSGIL